MIIKGALGSTRKDKLPPGSLVSKLHPSEYTEEQISTLTKKGEDNNKLHLISQMGRHGVSLFMVKMEYAYFPPRTAKNDLFEMVLLEWPEKNSLHWSIASFPIEFRAEAEKFAKECGLKFADGIPTLFGPDESIKQFPLDGKTVFTLENIPGHKTYTNDPKILKQLSDEENAACEIIFKADEERIKLDMARDGYSIEQIVRIFQKWNEGYSQYDEPPVGKKA